MLILKNFCAVILLYGSTAYALLPAMTEEDARQAVKSGACMNLPVGTGLVSGKGWVHSPIPGPHEFRVRGGVVGVTILNQSTYSLDAGRLYYMKVTAPTDSVVEWKTPGHEWGPMPKGFQLPPTGVTPALSVK